MQDTTLQLILHASVLVKGVLLVLLFFSVFSWSIILSKYYYLSAASKESEAFLKTLETSRDPKTLLETAKSLAYSPLANVFTTVYPEHGRLHREELSRIFRRHGSREDTKLHAYLTFLATTGSTTPFIGLFGTVWGIMNAFRGIGATGSASLAVVAPGIAEALITTAAGLAAAIPAVMAYNYYVSWARSLTIAMEDVIEELIELIAKRAA